MNRTTTVILILALLGVAFFAASRRHSSGPLIETRMLMGTVVEIRVDDNKPERFSGAVRAAFAEMARIEQLMSPHLPDSDLSRIAAATGAVGVASETAEVLALALATAKASGGAFDASLGRLTRLWGFAEGSPQLPTAEAIREALAGTGPNAFALKDGKVIKHSAAIALDLGGVAKGYAVDRAAAVLAAAGIRHASINAGGDIRLLGDRNGSLWRIGIQHPRHSGKILAKLLLADKAVVTSGDYERFFEQDGVRYHHILDPQTGYPARLCQAVTIVADRAALADAMATAVFVLGPERGMKLLAATAGVDGLIVAADGNVTLSEGLKESIVWP